MGSSVSPSCVCLFFLIRLIMGVSSSLVSDPRSFRGLSLGRISFLLSLGASFEVGGGGTSGISVGKGTVCLTFVVALGILILGGELSTTPLPFKRSKSN